MKERPILFSGPMVRAILDGRKTQTRRIIKPQPTYDGFWWSHKGYSCGGEKQFRDGLPLFVGCPYGKVGDRLWVRETWGPVCSFDPSPETGAIYRSDTHTGLEKRDGDQKWRPSIHMPRWASRLTLEITGVRVERLNEITPKDAIAEGCMPSVDSGLGTPENFREAARLVGGPYPRGIFAMLWNSINGPESWVANPWVWVVEFKRIQP